MSVLQALDIGLAFLVLAVAAWTIFARGAFAATVGYVVYGLLLALVWIRLFAVDVALTEAAIGSGVTGVLLIGAAARLRAVETAGHERTLSGVSRLFIAVLCVLVALALAGVVLLLPDQGPSLAPQAISATKIAVGQDGLFGAIGLDRVGWSNAGPIRRIFRQAFERADLPYFHPHSFRRTLAALGERLCRMPEDFKAWSQNLAHEGVLTTFSAYGAVAAQRQAEIINGMRRKAGTGGDERPLDRRARKSG